MLCCAVSLVLSNVVNIFNFILEKKKFLRGRKQGFEGLKKIQEKPEPPCRVAVGGEEVPPVGFCFNLSVGWMKSV